MARFPSHPIPFPFLCRNRITKNTYVRYGRYSIEKYYSRLRYWVWIEQCSSSSCSAVIVTCQKCKELYDTTCAYYGEKKRIVGKIIIAANFINVLC